MAQLAKTSYEFKRHNERYSLEGLKEEEAELARLEEAADKLPQEVLIGCLVNFPVADGQATYLVKKEIPLILQHLDFFDGYGLPSAHIRGIRLDDVRRLVKGQRGLKSIFSVSRERV